MTPNQNSKSIAITRKNAGIALIGILIMFLICLLVVYSMRTNAYNINPASIGISSISGKITTENLEEKYTALVKLYKTNDTEPRESVASVETNEDGTYSFNVPTGEEYDIVITKEGYLKHTITNITPVNKYIAKVQEVELIAGDVVESGEIEISDLVYMNNNIYKKADNKCDLNEDGSVDEKDREILERNYTKLEKKEEARVTLEAEKYTVSYDLKGGSGEIEEQIKTAEIDLTLSGVIPTKEGYAFLGWSLNEEATSVDYEAGGVFDLDEDTVLYAVWEINTYTVTLNKIGAGTVTGAGTYSYGTNVTITATTDDTFVGWYRGEELYSSEESLDIILTENLTLVAKFVVLVSNITLKQEETTLSPTSEVTGYYTNIRSINPTSQISAIVEPSTATNKNIIWTSSNPNIVSVDESGFLKFNGIDGTTTDVTISCASEDGNAIATFKARVIGYKNYVFYKNSTPYGLTSFYGLMANGVNISYDNDSIYLEHTSTNDQDFVAIRNTTPINISEYPIIGYKAVNGNNPLKNGLIRVGYTSSPYSGLETEWEDANNSIKFNVTESKYKDEYEEEVLVSPNTNAKYVYYATQTGDPSGVTSNPYTNLHYLYLYKDLPGLDSSQSGYTVRYDANGGIGDVPDSHVENVGDIVSAKFSSIPTREGYTFKGWSTSKKATSASFKENVNENFTMVAKNITLYAIWEVNTYTITLNTSGNGTGSVTGAGTYDYGTTVTITATTENAFEGWYKGNELYSSQRSVNILLTGDITLTAKFSILVSNIVLKQGNTNLYSTSEVTGYYANIENQNQTKQVIATVEPSNAVNKNIKWTSSNPNIVSVSDTGLLTFKGIDGTTKSATITCASEDGNVTKTFSARVNGYTNYIFCKNSTPYGLTSFYGMSATNVNVSYDSDSICLQHTTTNAQEFVGIRNTTPINVSEYAIIGYKIVNGMHPIKNGLIRVGYTSSAYAGLETEWADANNPVKFNVNGAKYGDLYENYVGISPSSTTKYVYYATQTGDPSNVTANPYTNLYYLYLYKTL